MPMTTWFDDPHRPTRDVDLPGYGDPAPESRLATFREICAIGLDGGITFDVDGLRAKPIREEVDYGGLRLRTTAQLAGARVTIVIDIGFGDAVEPGVEEVELPVLLNPPRPKLRSYARETVVAEKFQAMVALDLANSRMTDFYDIWMLSRHYDFDADRLARAIAAIFERRGTAIPAYGTEALSPAFANDATKRQKWTAFVRDLGIEVPPLDEVVADLARFLLPHARRATHTTFGAPPAVRRS